MNELDRPTGSRLSRKTREQRAYRLVLAAGGFGTLAIAGFVLAIAGVIGAGWPILAAVLAVVCGYLFRRTVS